MLPSDPLHRPDTQADGRSCDCPAERLASAGREQEDTACSSCMPVQPGRGGKTAGRGRGGQYCCCAANTQLMGPGSLGGSWRDAA